MTKSIRKKDYKKNYMGKWIKWFMDNNRRRPTEYEVKSWNYGFIAGYKARKKRIFAQLGDDDEAE